MSRMAKQIIYGAIYCGVFFVIVAVIYFLYVKPTPSCFDNIQNQGEEGVDCGGPCAKICTPTNIQPISAVGNIMTFTTNPHRVTFLARVVDANSDFAARSFDYRFDLYDASGSVIQSFSGQSFIYANEVKYLVLPNEDVTSSVSSVTFAAMDPEWAKSSDLGVPPQFVFQNVGTGMVSSGTIGVSGTITNEDASAFDNVTVTAVFKDGAGTPVGASQTELDNVAANGTYNFSVIYPATQNIDLTATEIEAYALRP